MARAWQTSCGRSSASAPRKATSGHSTPSARATSPRASSHASRRSVAVHSSVKFSPLFRLPLTPHRILPASWRTLQPFRRPSCTPPTFAFRYPFACLRYSLIVAPLPPSNWRVLFTYLRHTHTGGVRPDSDAGGEATVGGGRLREPHSATKGRSGVEQGSQDRHLCRCARPCPRYRERLCTPFTCRCVYL